ncbi:MAG: metal-dependent transcriptional regulator [Lachnospiraceae bacterium]|nr:metal-dependent transcriptional regulator [Lachnospiraceae bacterium]
MEKSNSSEDYMKSILVLLKRKGVVRSVDIADEMGVTRPSVCNAMKKLRQQDLIYFGDEGYIFFTETGKAIAEKIQKKHALISMALRSIGVNKKTADKEACLIEHAISDETYERLNEYIKSQFKMTTAN